MVFIFLSLSAMGQVEKTDTLIPIQKSNILSALADGIVTTGEDVARSIRYTGRQIRKVVNNVDTNYISPNKYNLSFMLEHSTWYEHYRLGSTEHGRPQSLNFAPNMGMKLGIYFGWRWIFLGYTFDIEDLIGKNKNKNSKLLKTMIFPPINHDWFPVNMLCHFNKIIIAPILTKCNIQCLIK